jgi:asparagine synthase (glutamine-hydrolysing)
MSVTIDEPFVQITGLSTPSVRGALRIVLGTPVENDEGVAEDGVWAQWHWDGRTLIVRNDRLGFYPLYYCVTQDSIAISPSIPKLLELGVDNALDDEGLAAFLRLGFFIGDHTPFRAIRALPPGATLRWHDGLLDLQHALPKPAASRMDRDKAMRVYADLFAEAIARRPPAGRCAVPLSGGRDSRHIALEMHRQGLRPHCVSAQDLRVYRNQESGTALRVARELGLPLTVVPQDRPVVQAELQKNELTNYCADEHGWYLPIAEYLQRNADTVYDGIGGDVLSAGLFLDEEGLALVRAGRFTEMAERITGWSERLLMRMLSPELRDRFPRQPALQSIAEEIARYADWPNPVGAFYLFNRTRREIALSPYRLLGRRLHVHAPYLDAELFDFLAALPAEHFVDHTFHTETIARAYPDYASIPYHSGGCQLRSDWAHGIAHAFRLLPLLLRRRHGLVDWRFAALRVARCALDPSYGAEFVHGQGRLMINLMQIGVVADADRPVRAPVPLGPVVRL